MHLTTWLLVQLMTSVVGGEFSEEELEVAGLNCSDVHDFMIGSNQMDIGGIREDGSRIPLEMETGQFKMTD